MKPLILLVAITLFPLATNAQTENPTRDLSRLVLGPKYSIEDQQARIKGFRNSKKFTLVYDKFKDESQIRVGSFNIQGRQMGRGFSTELVMNAILRYPGHTPDSRYNKIVLWFQAYGREWEFLKARHLYFVVDGERFDLGEGKWDGEIRRGTFESLGFVIPSDVFEKLGTAKGAEVRVGNVELTLKDEHKEAFRDLFSLSK